MSSQTLDTITNELRRAYKAVLLKIAHNLEINQQEGLRFYYDEIIKKGDTEALKILRSLEFAGKISWEDVSFIKERLNLVKRLDLVERLTAFEIKSNLILLLDLYARKRNKSEASRRFSSSVEMVSGYLVKLTTEAVLNGFDFNNIRSLVESRRGIKEVLVEFENESELTQPWSKLTLLVVIAGEIISEALSTEEHRRKLDVMKLCSIAADELYFRMIKIGSWVSVYDFLFMLSSAQVRTFVQ